MLPHLEFWRSGVLGVWVVSGALVLMKSPDRSACNQTHLWRKVSKVLHTENLLSMSTAAPGAVDLDSASRGGTEGQQHFLE